MTAPTGWGWELNIRLAEEIGYKLTGVGAAVIVPHSMGRFFAHTYSRKVWMDADISLLSRCHGIVAIPGWSESEGAVYELNYAEENGIPICYWTGIDSAKEWLERL